MRKLKQELYDALAQRVVISPLEICLTEAVTDPLTMLFPMREAGMDLWCASISSVPSPKWSIGAEPKVEQLRLKLLTRVLLRWMFRAEHRLMAMNMAFIGPLPRVTQQGKTSCMHRQTRGK